MIPTPQRLSGWGGNGRSRTVAQGTGAAVLGCGDCGRSGACLVAVSTSELRLSPRHILVHSAITAVPLFIHSPGSKRKNESDRTRTNWKNESKPPKSGLKHLPKTFNGNH